MARTRWRFLSRAGRPSDRAPQEQVCSGSSSVFQNCEEKDGLSFTEESEQLHLRLPSVNISAIDQDNCENAVSDPSVAQLEAALEDLMIDIINGGHSDVLKPNSGTAVVIKDYHVCVTCTENRNSEYRTWEWHGHIMIFYDGEGYVPEYVYGSFSEPVHEEEDQEKACLGVGFGLGQIVGEANGRIVT